MLVARKAVLHHIRNILKPGCVRAQPATNLVTVMVAGARVELLGFTSKFSPMRLGMRLQKSKKGGGALFDGRGVAQQARGLMNKNSNIGFK